MKFYSPLRYPGGKAKAVSMFKETIDANCMRNCVYVEPFAGGASVALSLLFDGYAERIIINDADPSIFAFWHSCLYNVDKFCSLLNKTEISINEWEIQRNRYTILRNEALQGNPVDLVELGFATFFLNRTNRSGILKGGIIGGHRQNSRYKINARFNKVGLEERLRKVSSFKDKIELHCEDAKQFLLNNSSSWTDNTIVYCDPPYVNKGKGLYMNYFCEKDHIDLYSVISELTGLKWIVTYDIHPLIASVYSKYRIKRFALSYSAQIHNSQAEEYIIFSDNLVIPDNKKISNM